jgi:hypothetical protein
MQKINKNRMEGVFDVLSEFGMKMQAKGFWYSYQEKGWYGPSPALRAFAQGKIFGDGGI